MLTKKIWTKNSNLIEKIKHNFSLENFSFEFLALVGRYRWKKSAKFFYYFRPLVSLLENIPYFHFLAKDGRAMSIYNFLLLRPCALVGSQNPFEFFINLLSFF